MTEEQGTARERLEASVAGVSHTVSDVVGALLDNLPLVMEAAREAGKAESVEGEETYDGGQWWRLLSDPEEQT